MSSTKVLYAMILGKFLKAELDSRGMTQKALAQQLNVSETAITSWIAGSSPGLDNVLRIVDLLDVSLDRAFGRCPAGVKELEKLRERAAPVVLAADAVLPDPSIVQAARRQLREAADEERKSKGGKNKRHAAIDKRGKRKAARHE